MKEMVKSMLWSSFYFVIGAATVIATLLLLGCSTFEPVQVKGQPDECNDYYTTLKYYVKTTEKDSAFVGTVFEKCSSAREEKRKDDREEKCIKRVYGADPFTKDQRYVSYLECLKQ